MKIALVIGHEPKRKGAELAGEKISEYAFWWTYLNFTLIPMLNTTTTSEYKVFKRGSTVKGYTAKMKALHKEIDEWGADLAISFHFNGSVNKAAGGMEILHSGYKPSKQLAEQLLQKLHVNLPGIKNRGLKKVGKGENGYGFVKYGKAKAMLVEPFFGSNEKEVGYVIENSEALNRAFAEFFKEIEE